MAEPVSPAPAPAKGAIASTVQTTVLNDAGEVEHVINSWHVNGWLLLGAILVANLIGVFFHV